MRVLFPTLPRLYALVALQWAPQDDLSVSYLAKSRSASPGVIPWLLQGTSAGRKAEIRP